MEGSRVEVFTFTVKVCVCVCILVLFVCVCVGAQFRPWLRVLGSGALMCRECRECRSLARMLLWLCHLKSGAQDRFFFEREFRV